MKVKHFGQIVDIDPRDAAIHHTVMHYLRRFEPLTERALWLKVRSRGCNDQQYRTAIDYLVERGLVIRETTNYTNSFVLHSVKQPRKRHTVELKEPALPPLTPEAA